jgi:hypothetical protein
MLPSEQVILATPMSWAGSTCRIWRNFRPAVARAWLAQSGVVVTALDDAD